jgi:hypothetical protein
MNAKASCSGNVGLSQPEMSQKPTPGTCATAIGFAIVCLFRRCFDSQNERQRKKKQGLDDERKTPHNLASLLLTNTTLRTVQQGSTEQRFFNNQQSISVGV